MRGNRVRLTLQPRRASVAARALEPFEPFGPFEVVELAELAGRVILDPAPQ